MRNVKRQKVLEVPYTEKEQAKKLGAWWDPEIKKWFVPEGRDVSLFKQWFPENQNHHAAEQ